jgi:hypothetical protein
MPNKTYFHHGQYRNSVPSELDSDEFMWGLGDSSGHGFFAR